MNYSAILSDLGTFVEQSFKEVGPILPYHNAEHTKTVLLAANQLADHYKINEEDRFIINAAAWFHDLGNKRGEVSNHEFHSAAMAEDWLKARQVPSEIIEKIKGCIMATKIPQKPTNLNEQIIADADLWHLGTENFSPHQKLLRLEATMLEGKEPDSETWRAKNIEFLSSHQFHTEYARNLLQLKKEEHISRLKEKQEKKLNPEENTKKKKEKRKDTDPNIPTRGIETMFRVTIHNHLELSSMADAKANIMISVNAIIVSVVLSVLLRRLEEQPQLIIPTGILLTVNVLTIVFAILAVRPKIMKSTSNPIEQKEDKKANLLFFGSFNKMPLDLYTLKMKDMMGDKDYLYENMINNIYFMGVVLGRKYHWLRIAYNVFMYGFIVAVVAFSIAMII